MSTIYLTDEQVRKMENTIIDEETGMTEFDYWEWSHPHCELVIIEAIKEELNGLYRYSDSTK